MNTTATEGFLARCQRIQPLLAEARTLAPHIATNLLKLDTRFETIILMPRGGGKTAIGHASSFGGDAPICEVGGYLDEAGQPLPVLAKTITGMLKLRREQRALFPLYKPKIFLRPETWARMAGRFYYVEPYQIAQVEFPAQAFWGSLGLKPAQEPDFNDVWLDSCRDATGKLLPGLAFDALQETIARAPQSPAVGTAKWQGYAVAAAKHVAAQTDLAYILAYMAAGDKSVFMSGAKVTISLDRIYTRIRQARRARIPVKLPYGMTAPQFVRYCEEAGVWKVNHMRYAVWSTPYAVGTSFLKARLTDAAFARMLSA